MAFRILQSDEWFVDRIIAQAGVARATLFRHFPTKDDLIAAYLERRALRARDTLSALRDDYRDEPDRVLAAIADVVDDYRDQPGFRGCEIINATAELSDPAHPARRLAIDHRQCALVGASLEVGVTDSSIGALLWKSLARKGLRGLTEGADGLVMR